MMNLCRIFWHTFVLSSIPGSDEFCLSCRRCPLTEMVCRSCMLKGYEEGIGGRQIPCHEGPHRITVLGHKRAKPRGRIILG